MLELVKQLFDQLMGFEVSATITFILTFTVVATMVGKFFDLLQIKGTLWNYAIKICIAYIAISSLGGVEWAFSLS